MQNPDSLPAQPPSNEPPAPPEAGSGTIAVHRPRALQTQLRAHQEAQNGLDAGDEIDLKAIVRTLMRHKWTIVGSTLLCMLAAALYTLRVTPQYESTALLQIERAAQKVVGFNSERDLDQGTSAEALTLRTQIELLSSRTLAERVIDELGLAKRAAPQPGEDAPRPGDPATTATTQQTDTTTDATSPGVIDQFSKNFLQLFTPSTQNSRDLTRAETLRAFEKSVSVEPIRNSRLVEIRVLNSDAALSANIANTMAKTFIAINLERKMESSVYARQFLEEQIKQTKAKLEESERVINEYAKRNSILSLGDKNSATTQNYVDFSSALAKAEQDRIKAESQYNEVRLNPESAPRVLDNLAIQTYKEQKAKLDAEYAKNLSIYKPGYPAMVQLKAQIADLDARIKDEVNTILASIKGQYEVAKRQEELLRQRVATSRQEVLTVQDRSVDMNLLQRELDSNRQVYDNLLQRLKEVSVTGGLTTNNVSIVDEARAPLYPANPKPMVNLALGMVLGGFLGVLIALLREQMDDSIKNADEVEGLFGLPLLGLIPFTKKPRGGNEAVALLAHSDPRSAFAEAYRSMRTALQFSTNDGAPKRFMVTSCGKNEGKSTTALALAINFAQLGQHVLLIDADMRKPSMHKALGLPNERGLSNLLTGDSGTEQLILATPVPNLGVLPAGPTPPDPVELLMGPKLGMLLDKAQALGFHQVIIDGPPLLGLADAVVLGNQIQHIVFALKASATKKSSIKDGLRRLRNAGLQPMGVAMTHARAEHSSNTTDESYYGYGLHLPAPAKAKIEPGLSASAAAAASAEGPVSEIHLGATSAEQLLQAPVPPAAHGQGAHRLDDGLPANPPSKARRWAAGLALVALSLGAVAWWFTTSTQTVPRDVSAKQDTGKITESPTTLPATPRASETATPATPVAADTAPLPATPPEMATVAMTPTAPLLPAPSNTPPVLATLKDGTADTWAPLAALWSETLDPQGGCGKANEVNLQCFRLNRATLNDLKKLDQPGLVQLKQGRVQRWVLLRSLDDTSVTLASGDSLWQLPTDTFNQQWTGRYSTLWRLPPGQQAPVTTLQASSAAGAWLDAQLKSLQAGQQLEASADSLAARVRQFQKQQGLPTQRSTLPLVFIRLNHMVGQSEPRLVAGG
ncbi:MAG: polysaccharide biosynthesis tyrosine autokinase [Burkholderiaceae bacterium]